MADLSGTPIFVEELYDGSKIGFDQELDRFACDQALTKLEVDGYCNVCDDLTQFQVNSDNFREDLLCRKAGCINRHRQIVCGLSTAIFGVPSRSLPEICRYINSQRLRVYSADANSSLYRALSRHIDPELIIFSEYFGPDFESGSLVNGIRHEDLQKTSFDSGEFDIVITSEVFEHIPKVYEAESEVARILAPGGIYCFTVPFAPFNEHDIILADVNESGETLFFGEPQYHGDPIRPEEGILVYRIFSFNDLKKRFSALHCGFTAFRFWSRALGVLGDNGWVHIVRKEIADDSSVETLASGNGRSLSAPHLRTLWNSRIDELKRKILRLENELALSRAQEAELREVIAGQTNALAQYSEGLESRDRMLNWINSSRSWRTASRLRRWQESARQLRQSLPGGARFTGQIESVAQGEEGRLEVRGWAASSNGRIILAEVFADDFYLGALDLSTGEGESQSRFSGSLYVPSSAAGEKRLTVRIFDDNGSSTLVTYRNAIIIYS